MNDVDLVNFFKKGKENICGRFAEQQLNKDILIPSRKIPWLRYLFQVAIPAFLFASKATAQGNIKVVQKHVVDKKRVKSSIVPEPVNCNINVTPVASLKSIQDEEPVRCYRMISGAVATVTSQTLNSHAPVISGFSMTNSFTIFPNPVVSNSGLNIKWKKTIASDQTVRIYNLPGTLIQNEILRVYKNTIENKLHLNQLFPGTYIIRITDNKTQKTSSQQFIVL